MKNKINDGDASIQIKLNQLPLHCPLPEINLWNQHPKVYLPIDAFKKVKCPYCGTEYELTD
tara:strand:- start:3469 stop:3651 length:183 start_codon:yes stop_codon:yes gene_type:complete